MATQSHPAPEGIYVHQFSHLFFMVSMGILIYWLRAGKLHRQRAWQFIQYAAVCFMLWTFDAFLTHLLDEQLQWVHVIPVGSNDIRIENVFDSDALSWFYYLIKLDHLLCVPAMYLLYKGLKLLWKSSDTINPQATGQPPR